MKTKVDAELCIGCELCVQTAPQVFQMKDDKAIPTGNTVPANEETNCKEAADSCPVNAISIEE